MRRPSVASRIGLVLAACAALACPAGLAAALPAEIKALVEAKKFDEANQKLPALVAAAGGAERQELIRLAYDTDPDLSRLKANLKTWLGQPGAEGGRAFTARLLAQLCLLQRDYASAQAAYALMGHDPEAAVRSAGLLLLLGRGKEAKDQLVNLLKQSGDPAVIERASCILAWIVWSDGDPATGLAIVKGKKSAPALYLNSVLSRVLGQKKDDQAARDLLVKDWPRSIWTSLAEPDADPAIQMETGVLILSGIGAAAAGDVPSAGAGSALAGGKAGDDNPARAIQVSYHKEHKYAKALSDKLNAKGFMSQVEEDKAA
jgi:hypothetical protein